MKQIYVLLLFMLSTTAFSAYQYNTKGNQTWITFDTTTELYFGVERSGKDKDHENFIDKGEGISDWGWYNMTTNESGSFKNGQYTFTENDKIALWVKDNNGNSYLSTKMKDSDYIWGKSGVDNDVLSLYGGNNGSNGTHEHYVFTVKVVPNGNQTPSGQPLPGILATLAIGGTGIYYIKNRKRLLEGKEA